MASLEYLVRPFQSPNAFGKTLIPSTPQNTHEKATITWGATAALPNVINGISVQCRAQKNIQREFPSEHYIAAPPIDGVYGQDFEWRPAGDQGLYPRGFRNWFTDYSGSETWADTYKDFDGWGANIDGGMDYVQADTPIFDTSEKESCISDWDQFSGVGAEITGALADFAADIHSGTLGGNARQTRTQMFLDGSQDWNDFNDPNPFPNG